MTTLSTLACRYCVLPHSAERVPDEIGLKLYGVCPHCCAVTLDHDFADLNRPTGSSNTAPISSRGGDLTWRAPRVVTSFSFSII